MHLCDTETSAALRALLARYGLELAVLDAGASLPGSYWGEPEAGIVGSVVYARSDTPVHSALHEAAHVICMDAPRRARLHTDAGGDYAEENAVCYLQIVLARHIGLTERELCADMDAWGYTFRLGSAYAWFADDADDARTWLVGQGLLTSDGAPVWRCRGGQAADIETAERRDAA
jgi:hypothetical protein